MPAAHPRPTLLRGLAVAIGLAACKSPPPPELPIGLGPAPVVPLAPGPPPELGAFTVLTIDRTVVVPLDPERGVVELPGHWVGADPIAEASAWGHLDVLVTTMADEGATTIPVCAWGDFGDACELPVDLDEPDPRVALESASKILRLMVEVRAEQDPRWTVVDRVRRGSCPCVVVQGLSTDGEPAPEYDLEDPEVLEWISMSPYDPDEYEDHCSEEALRPDLDATAVLGGVLYENGMTHNGVCNGLNLYDGASEQIILRPGSGPPEMEFPPAECSMQDIGVSGPDLDGADPDSVPCDDTEELLAYAIDRGRLLEATGGIATVGEECACVSAVPLVEATCPSAFDPCGDGRGFSALDPDAGRWWASTDGEWALVVDGEGATLLSSDAAEPVRVTDAFDEDDVLGVELHPSSALLEAPKVPEVLRPAIPPLHENDQDFRGSAIEWGNRCFVHLKQRRFDAAEAACFAGLMEGGNERTRGAITYSLGRVAEERAQPERALAYYRRSDRLRPGNETVRKRIAALGGE